MANTVLGFSDAAEFVDGAATSGTQYLKSARVFGLNSNLRTELENIWGDCRTPNWDGFDAVAINDDTIRNTYILLESLPIGIAAPSLGVEPDGHITLEWHREPHRTISVSVGDTGELYYAALIGDTVHKGAVEFLGELPRVIEQLVAQILSA